MIIMLTFFIVKSLLLFGVLSYSIFTNWYEYLSVILFMPPFFTVVAEFLNKTKIKIAKIDTQLKAIDASNLIVTLDINGILLSANKNFCDLVGYTEKELVGKKHSELCSMNLIQSQEYKNFWEQLQNGQFISGEFERIGKDGKSKWLFGTYTPLQDTQGNYHKVLKIAVNVTSQHEAEELIKQKNVYLEHASKIIRHDMHSGINTYLPRGIKSLKRRLSEDQIKELKISTPLQLIQDGLHHAQKVYAGVYEFTNLVKENQQLNLHEVNLREILKSYLKLTAYKNQVILDDSLDKILSINEALICTAIDNLIRNGLKYNDSKTKWVKVSSDDNHIFIEDNGRGMSQKDFEVLSKPYARKEGQKESGTGLGLNICIEILKEHKFEIISEKTKDGTKLTITI